MSSKSEIKNVAEIFYILAGVLFGAILMAFIFSFLGPSNAGLTTADPGFNESLQIQNNSLAGFQSYSSQSTTQYLVLGIIVTLVILIGLFVFFMKTFGGKGKKKSNFGA